MLAYYNFVSLNQKLKEFPLPPILALHMSIYHTQLHYHYFYVDLQKQVAKRRHTNCCIDSLHGGETQFTKQQSERRKAYRAESLLIHGFLSCSCSDEMI